MSAWTALSRAVFDSRYAKTSSWYSSATPLDTYWTNHILDARRDNYLYPGSIYNQNGAFGKVQGKGHKTNSGDFNTGSFYEGFTWRPIPTELGGNALQAEKGGMDENSSWYRQDWDLSTLVAGGMSPGYAEYLKEAAKIWTKALGILDWVPPAVAIKVQNVILMGFVPNMLSVQMMRESPWAYVPSWLNTPGRQAAWDAVRDQFSSINRAVSNSNLVRLRQQAAEIEKSVAFWDGVAKWSGVDLAEKKWADLKAKIKEFNQNKRQVDESARRIDALLAATPEAFSDEQKREVMQIKAKAADTTLKAKLALGGPLMDALVSDGTGIAGLGIAPVIIISIGVAAIAAASVSIIAYTSIMENTRREIMRIEASMLEQQTKFNQNQLAQTNASVAERIAQLDGMLDAGKISADSHARQVADLLERKRSAGQDFVQLQNLNKQMAKQFNEDAKEAPESSTVQLFGQMKWLGLAAAFIVGTIYIAPRIAGKKA